MSLIPGSPRLRPVDALVAPAVAETLRNTPDKPEDAALRRLAERYAAAIDADPDDPDMLAKLGPKLLTALAELGATPKARGTWRGAGGAGDAANASTPNDPSPAPRGGLRALREARGA